MCVFFHVGIQLQVEVKITGAACEGALRAAAAGADGFWKRDRRRRDRAGARDAGYPGSK